MEKSPSASLLNAMTDPLLPYKWLASDAGATELAAATQMRFDGLADLKIGEHLRTRLDFERAALVLTQLDLRIRSKGKFSHASQMLFTRAGLEQATNERIARYRTERFQGFDRITDLCCGIGGDLIAFASTSDTVSAVDRDPVHLFLAEYNARIYTPDADIRSILGNVEDVPIDAGDAVFIDPARRLQSGKRIGYHSEPPLEWSLALVDNASAVGIKTAPGIPHELVPVGWEMELIALGSDLKEAVLWSPSVADHQLRATVIDANGVTSLTPMAGEPVVIRDVHAGDWLHDVNPAVTNVGLVEDLARKIDADRIDSEIGFLVSDGLISHPMVSNWRVLEVLPWHEKRIKQSLVALDVGPVDIRRRGLAGDVPTITKRLRGKGKQRVMIAMTRMSDVPTAVICSLE